MVTLIQTKHKFFLRTKVGCFAERCKTANMGCLHKFTAKADDWELFLFIPADDYAHAIRIERKIKAMKSAKFIIKLKENNDLREWLVSSS